MATRKLVKSIKKTKETTTVAPRRRLAPEVRAGLILDCAAKLILEGGFTEITMERVGRDAGVSKALIYNYFPNLTDLLQALLARELEELQKTGVVEIKASGSYHDLVRRTTGLYIRHVAERGPLLQRLWNEPSVAGSFADVHRRSNEETLKYFAKRTCKEYGLPMDVAIAAVDMQMSLTETAAQRLYNANGDVDLATDIAVHLLLGGMESLSRAYRKT